MKTKKINNRTIIGIVCIVLALVVTFGVAPLVNRIEIKMMHGISKSFGHGAGFTVGLILLTFIFQLILSFGSSKYKPVNKRNSK